MFILAYCLIDTLDISNSFLLKRNLNKLLKSQSGFAKKILNVTNFNFNATNLEKKHNKNLIKIFSQNSYCRKLYLFLEILQIDLLRILFIDRKISDAT